MGPGLIQASTVWWLFWR